METGKKFDQPVPPHNPDGDRPVDEFLTYLESMAFFADSANRGSLKSFMSYYRRRAAWHHRIFRTTGLMSIVLSLSLPVLLLAFREGNGHGQVLTAVVAALVALSTTINSFLRSDSSWHGARQCLLTLHDFRARWELAIVAARVNPDVKKGVAQARRATDDFISSVHEMVRSEANRFFSGLKFPARKFEKEDGVE